MSESPDRKVNPEGQGQDQYYVLERNEKIFSSEDFDANNVASTTIVVDKFPSTQASLLSHQVFDVWHYSDDPGGDGFDVDLDEMAIKLPYKDPQSTQAAWFKTGYWDQDGGVVAQVDEDNSFRGIFFKPDGTKMFLNGDDNDSVFQYSLSVAWDISSATYDNVSFGLDSGRDSLQAGLFFKPDGTKMYTAGRSLEDIFQYSLSTAWDLSTASGGESTLDTSNEADQPRGVALRDDGKKVYVCDADTNTIYQYSLSTAWDVSTGTYDNVSFVINEDDNPVELVFDNDGNRMYVIGNTNNEVFQYSLDEWDLSTASYDGVSYVLDSQSDLSNPTSMSFKADGDKLFVVGALGTDLDDVFEFLVSTAFDLSTATFNELNILLEIVYKAPSSSGSPFSTDELQTFKYIMYTAKPL